MKRKSVLALLIMILMVLSASVASIPTFGYEVDEAVVNPPAVTVEVEVPPVVEALVEVPALPEPPVETAPVELPVEIECVEDTSNCDVAEYEGDENEAESGDGSLDVDESADDEADDVDSDDADDESYDDADEADECEEDEEADDELTIADVWALHRYVSRRGGLTVAQRERLDINEDGVIDILDLVLAKREVRGR